MGSFAQTHPGGYGVEMLILFTGVLSALLTRLQIRADSWLGLTAAPRADRWHAVPTPSSGGLAIFLSCAAAYWLACPGRYPRIAWAVAALWIFAGLSRSGTPAPGTVDKAADAMLSTISDHLDLGFERTRGLQRLQNRNDVPRR